jgi:hypothetical protein
MIKKLAWIFGIALVCIGLLGLIPGIALNGLLFGIFATDAMVSLVYLISGALALWVAWRSASNARIYFKIFGIIYALITLGGFLGGGTVFGLMVANTPGDLLDLVIALVALWAGFGASEEATGKR